MSKYIAASSIICSLVLLVNATVRYYVTTYELDKVKIIIFLSSFLQFFFGLTVVASV